MKNEYYDQRWRSEGIEERPPNQLRVDLVASEVVRWVGAEMLESPKIVDIGCGNGWILDEVNTRLKGRCHISGLEPSPVGVENTSKKIPSADIRQGTLSQCDFSSGFDVVICSEVLEHVEDQEEFIDRLFYFLRKDGLLVLTTPNGRYRESYFNTTDVDPQPVENWLDRDELSSRISKHSDQVVVSTFELDYFYLTNSGIDKCKKIFWRIKGGWRFWRLMERMMEVKLGLGLYLMVVAKS